VNKTIGVDAAGRSSCYKIPVAFHITSHPAQKQRETLGWEVRSRSVLGLVGDALVGSDGSYLLGVRVVELGEPF
jgi:hypothetical protein